MAVAGLLLGVGLLAFAWFRGGVAAGLVYVADRLLLPHQFGPELSLTGIRRLTGEPGPAEDRIRLTVSRDRLRQALAAAGDWSRALPPGLLQDRLTVEAAWTPHSRNQPVDIEIPLQIVVGETEGDHPHLAGTLPVSALNAFIAVEFAEDFVNENEEYLLGHFDYTFRPTIREATVRTTTPPALPPELYPTQLGLEIRARGTVKLSFEENLFRTSTDASISDLRLLLTVAPRPTDDGVILDYDARFTRLKGNVRKLHSIGDRWVSDRLESKWTRSLNKEKRKRKLARHPLPAWAPLDLVVDLAFYPAEAPADGPGPGP